VIRLVMEADVRRLEREHNARAWQAYATAALVRAKKMPRLQTLLIEPPKERRRQTWQEQLAIAKAITAQFSKRKR